MDFQNLTRRELQVLCKKNKIPANMTNAAMADALKALHHVEGLLENPESIFDAAKILDIGELSSTTPRTSTRRRTLTETEKKDNKNVSGKEDPSIPVLSVRRSARLSEKRLRESAQTKDSRRIEAVKFAVLCEEESEYLEKEKLIEGSENSMSKENEVTDLKVSDNIVVINHSTSEICNTEESSVVDSRGPYVQDGEEGDKPVTVDVVSDADPLSAEFQGSGSLTTDKLEKEEKIYCLSELLSMEDQDGATLVKESLSPEEICESESKESMVEASLPKASKFSPSKESTVGDSIGDEKQGMDKLKVDERCEGNNEEGPVFVLEKMQTKVSEGLLTDESGELTEESVIELEDISSLSLEKTSEMEFLETRCLGFCPIEKPGVVDEDVEGINDADKLAGEEPVSPSGIEGFIPDQVQKCDPGLDMNNGINLSPCKNDDILLEMLNCVSDHLDKSDIVPELENAGNPFLTEAASVDEKCSGKKSSPINVSEIHDCVAASKGGIDDSLICSDGVEEKVADQAVVADDNSIGEIGKCDHHVAESDTRTNAGSDLLDSSSAKEGGEQSESSEALVFNVVGALSALTLTDFHSENKGSAISASAKSDQTKEASILTEAGQDAEVSLFYTKEEVFNIQSSPPTLFSSMADHVTEAKDTANAQGGEDRELSSSPIFSNSGLFSAEVLTDFHSENRNSAISASEERDQIKEPSVVMETGKDAVISSFFSKEEVLNIHSSTVLSSMEDNVTEADDTVAAQGEEDHQSSLSSASNYAGPFSADVPIEFHSENRNSAIGAIEKCDLTTESGTVIDAGQDRVSSFCSKGEEVLNAQSPTDSSIATAVTKAGETAAGHGEGTEHGSGEASVFNITELSTDVLSNFQYVKRNSATGASVKCYHTEAPGTMMEAGQDAVFFSTFSNVENVLNVQSLTVFSSVSANVTATDDTTTVQGVGPELFPAEVLTDFCFESKNSATGASEKCDQTKEPGKLIEARDDAVISLFCSEGEEVYNIQSSKLFSSAEDTSTAAIDYEVPMLNEDIGNDDLTSVLHIKDATSAGSSAISPLTTPVKSLKTPVKSASKRRTPIRMTVSGGSKENNQNVSSSYKEYKDMSKTKVANSQKEYKDISIVKMKRLIKEKEEQLENKRTALQTLNKN